MDLHALMIVWSNTCISPTDRYQFDDIFKKYYGTDSTLVYGVLWHVCWPKKNRGSPVSHQRLNWQSYVQQLLKEGTFWAMYRMHHESFYELVHLLSPLLTVNIKQGRNRNHGGDHVYVELIVHVMLRYMVGGSFHDIRVTAGVATSTFFHVYIVASQRWIAAQNWQLNFLHWKVIWSLLHLHLKLKAMVVCSTDALQILMAGFVELRCLLHMIQ